MDINQTIIVITSIFLIVLILIFSSAFTAAGKSIFPGSGDPLAMGNILITTLRTSLEIIFGFFGVVILAILIANNYLTSEIGLPIIASIISYTLGKGFKTFNDTEKK